MGRPDKGWYHVTATRNPLGSGVMAPAGFDALAGLAMPIVIVESSRPGLIGRALLNTAAASAFLGQHGPDRWQAVDAAALHAIGLEPELWLDKTAPNDSAGQADGPAIFDRQIGPDGQRHWWRLTVSEVQASAPQRQVIGAVRIDDLQAQSNSPDSAVPAARSGVMAEIEELAGFGHYAFWPQERAGIWTGGMARIWSVPEPHSPREFENMVALIHGADLQSRAEGGERSTVLTDAQEVRIVRTDGEVRYIRSLAARHVDAGGLIQRVVRIDQDVTDLRRTEEELRLAREAAGDAARAKEAFLHLMNHSLRTPLNAILGFGEAMRDQIYGPLSADYAQSIEAVNDSATRLLELVDDILDLTRLESGRYSLSKSVCDLNGIIAETIDLMAPRVTERNLRLAAAPPASAPVTVWGEERGLRQILVNLLQFATVSGRSVHTITISARTAGTGEAVLCLEDDGNGLQRQIEYAIRDPLGTDMNVSEAKGASSWFGLSLVKSFLQLHNGSLRAEDLPEGRFRIEVTLPR